VLNGVNFAKDYEKDSYNNNKIIEKIIDDKNILTTLKKTFIFLKMWNSKTLKIQ
jgi:IMP cyclohydrolase